MTLQIGPCPHPCPCCKQVREDPHYPQHSLGCVHCGARLIQAIARYPIPAEQVVQRRRAVLADWVAWGHSEAQIRALAKGNTAIADPGPAPPSASDHPSPQKRR
jgi:hypothetical protein